MKSKIKKTLFGKTQLIFDLDESLDLRSQFLEIGFEKMRIDKPSKYEYLLLKDLPFLKAGTVITYNEDEYGLVTTYPLKLLQEFEGHYLDWMMKDIHENPGKYRGFIQLIK